MHDNLGFIINDEGRQHINLSSEAMMIIEGDMIKFNNDYELKNKSGFINTVITNYYDTFVLSPSNVFKQLDLLQGALKIDDLGKRVVNAIVSEFSKEMMRNAIHEYSSRYSSDIQFKLKLNNKNIGILRELEEAKYYDKYAPRSGIAFYLKVLLESYTELKREERERIYHKEIIDMIERAIKRKSLIRYKDGDSFKKVTPIFIHKPLNQQSLEVFVIHDHGLSDNEFAQMESLKIKHLATQNVKDLKEKADHKKVLTDIFKNEMLNIVKESEKTSKKPTQDFVVRFTKLGLQRYFIEEDNIPMVGIQDPNNENIVTFKTTETKIFHHIFKYGAQAQILSPQDARERFMKLYKVSHEIYAEKIQ